MSERGEEARWLEEGPRVSELEAENEQLRAALDAVFDEAVDVHENAHPMMSFRDYLRHRLGTFSHGYAVQGFKELVAERDALRAVLSEIHGYLRIGGTQTHEHIGKACGVDACVVCLVEARAREALGDRGSPS